MKKLLLLALLSCALCSCATLFNSDATSIKIYSDTPVTVDHKGSVSKSNVTYPAEIAVMRSQNPVILDVKNDSTAKQIVIASKLDTKFYHNWITYGIGYLVDLTNSKRYTYNSKIYLDRNLNVYKPSPTRKGDIYFDLSFPTLNYYSFTPIQWERRNGEGFLGITGGIDYYYKNNRFITLSGSAVLANGPLSMEVGEGEREQVNSLYLSLTHNHRFNKFSLGYGLSYSRNAWTYQNDYYSSYWSEDWLWNADKEVLVRAESTNYALGLDFNVRYFFNNSFNIGVGYRPSFYRFAPASEFRYEHFININWGFKIKLKKGK